jgi:imidazolonepropionase-like amidohydrolase
MIRFFYIWLFFFSFSIKAQPKSGLIISNPTIIQISDGALIRGYDIVIENDRITGVLKHKEIYPGELKIIDASGKFLMPGLWDMHIHFGGGDSLAQENKNLLPLFIAHGITAVRDAAADLSPYVLQWRAEIANGTLFGPTIFTSGPKIEGINSIWVGDLEVGSISEMIKAMDSLQDLSVDFIKVTDNTLNPKIYLEAIREARRRGLKISGHIPNALSIQQVSAAGLSSIEHMSYVLRAASKEEANIATKFANGSIHLREVMPLIMNSFDEGYALDAFKRLAINGTAVVPTLSISRVTAYLDQEDHWKDDYLKYIGQGLKNTYWWRVKRAESDSNEAIDLRHRIFEKSASLLPLLKQAGVTIIAGTDAGYLNSFDYPGLGLHTELELMVKYGLSPLEALQSSIINGPAFFSKQNVFGKIEKGFMADLILLNENPLSAISNTRKIYAVIKSGKYFSRPDLDILLMDTEKKASQSPFKPLNQ